jgi:hypothetical protein
MVVVLKKKTRLAQQPAFHYCLFSILCFITLAYLYSDSDLPLSSTSDFLVKQSSAATVDKIITLPPHGILKQSAPQLSMTSDLFVDNADKELLLLAPHTIAKESALPSTITSDLVDENAIEDLLPLAPNVTTKSKKRAQNRFL